MNRALFTAAALCAALAAVPACHHGGMHHDAHGQKEKITHAICILSATDGNAVTGWVKFEQTADGTRVTATVDGLTPGLHGFHVHHLGDISAGDGTATAGHYNPHGVDHGLPSDGNGDGHGHGHMEVGGHVGDLGNLDADANGRATYDVTFKDLKLHYILGRSIIVHRDEDDGGQPTGNAGPRIAQGVIGIDAAE